MKRKNEKLTIKIENKKETEMTPTKEISSKVNSRFSPRETSKNSENNQIFKKEIQQGKLFTNSKEIESKEDKYLEHFKHLNSPRQTNNIPKDEDKNKQQFINVENEKRYYASNIISEKSNENQTEKEFNENDLNESSIGTERIKKEAHNFEEKINNDDENKELKNELRKKLLKRSHTESLIRRFNISEDETEKEDDNKKGAFYYSPCFKKTAAGLAILIILGMTGGLIAMGNKINNLERENESLTNEKEKLNKKNQDLQDKINNFSCPTNGPGVFFNNSTGMNEFQNNCTDILTTNINLLQDVSTNSTITSLENSLSILKTATNFNYLTKSTDINNFKNERTNLLNTVNSVLANVSTNTVSYSQMFSNLSHNSGIISDSLLIELENECIKLSNYNIDNYAAFNTDRLNIENTLNNIKDIINEASLVIPQQVNDVCETSPLKYSNNINGRRILVEDLVSDQEKSSKFLNKIYEKSTEEDQKIINEIIKAVESNEISSEGLKKFEEKISASNLRGTISKSLVDLKSTLERSTRSLIDKSKNASCQII